MYLIAKHLYHLLIHVHSHALHHARPKLAVGLYHRLGLHLEAFDKSRQSLRLRFLSREGFRHLVEPSLGGIVLRHKPPRSASDTPPGSVQCGRSHGHIFSSSPPVPPVPAVAFLSPP